MKLLAPLAMLAASIGLFVFFINPQYQHVTDLRNQARDYDDAIVRAKDVVNKRNALLAKKNSFNQADLDKLKKLLPDNVDNVQLIIDTNNVAGHYSAALKNIKVISTANSAKQGTVGTDTKAYGNLTLAFDVTMTYDQFQQFLKELESSLRIIDVASVSFTPDQTGASNYDYSVAIRTYWLKP